MFTAGYGYFPISCSSLNGRGPETSEDDGVKGVERLLEEKRRAEMSARIASGEFTVDDSGYMLGLLCFKCWCGFLWLDLRMG